MDKEAFVAIGLKKSTWCTEESYNTKGNKISFSIACHYVVPRQPPCMYIIICHHVGDGLEPYHEALDLRLFRLMFHLKWEEV